MTPFYDDGRVVLHVGHVLTVLAGLEPGSVQTVVTSPPYWGLRSYGTEPQVWESGNYCGSCMETDDGDHRWMDGTDICSACGIDWHDRHLWEHEERRLQDGTVSPKQATHKGNNGEGFVVASDTCTRCGAWRGELGSEPTPEQYVANIVAVFRAVRRVLRDDGTLWLNLGDSYASGEVGRVDAPQKNKGLAESQPPRRERRIRQDTGLKPKDLVGIPWRVAFALQADGWYLRSDIIWHKPNPMPESVTDRPTKAHEYLFLLSKRAEYFYDGDAVREAYKPESLGRYAYALQGTAPTCRQDGGDVGRREREKGVHDPNPNGRNRRSVWTIPTEAYPAAHFATFPRKLVEPCILAGTSARGQCPACGAPWARTTERAYVATPKACKGPTRTGKLATEVEQQDRGVNWARDGHVKGLVRADTTTGWAPSCACNAGDPVPQVCLDPFAGSGTTLAVARWHQRRAVGIELNPEYARLIEQRLAQGVLL